MKTQLIVEFDTIEPISSENYFNMVDELKRSILDVAFEDDYAGSATVDIKSIYLVD